MDISMGKEELEDYLSKPLIARIASIDSSSKEAKAHIAPVWFIYENGTLLISTGKDSKKVKNIRKNPGVAVSIDTTEGGFKSKGVIFFGRAELIEENAREITERIYMKYLHSLSNPFAQQLLNMPRVVIKIKPDKIISWDYEKMKG